MVNVTAEGSRRVYERIAAEVVQLRIACRNSFKDRVKRFNVDLVEELLVHFGVVRAG